MAETDSSQLFDYDDTQYIVQRAVDDELKNQAYNPKKVQGWIEKVHDRVMKDLQKAAKPYKYVVSTVVMQKTGAGLHTASTCFWDKKSDGSCSVKWENKTIYVIVTVFALHI